MNAVAHKKTYAHPTWLTTVTTRIVYKKGLKTLTTRIVYKIRGSSFSSKNLNLEWIKNEPRANPFEVQAM